MSCVVEVERSSLSLTIKKSVVDCSKNSVRKFLVIGNFMWRIVNHAIGPSQLFSQGYGEPCLATLVFRVVNPYSLTNR